MLAVFAKAADPLSAGRNIPGGCFSHARLRIAPVSQVVAAWIPKAAGLAYASKVRGDGTVVLCTSTCDPDRIEALGVRLAGTNIRFLETPVTGTSEQVRQGDGLREARGRDGGHVVRPQA